MFAIVGCMALILLIFIRPFEVYEWAKALKLLYIAQVLAVLGLALDLRLRIVKPWRVPQLVPALIFFGWCLVTVAVKAPREMLPQIRFFATSLILFITIAHCVQSFRMMHVVAGTMLAITFYLAAICIHQKTQDFQCIKLDPTIESGWGTPDGRPCRDGYDNETCEDGGEPGQQYNCERVGVLGTQTIAGRVRYLGILMDPNEVAMILAISLPFAFCFFERRRTLARRLFLYATIIIVGVTVVFTQSRGGQLVILIVLGTYFVGRYGVKGLMLGAVMGAPLLLFGGRSGRDAAGSSDERLAILFEGMTMFKENPIVGVGMGQFTEHFYQTAHNSYVLCLSELGYLGLLFWLGVIYLTIKIPVLVWLRYRNEPQADIAVIWARAILTSWLGFLAGIFFLSYSYAYILWIYIGVSGALYSTVRAHDPSFRVKYGVADFAAVIVLTTGLTMFLYAFTRLKPGG